MVEKPRYINVGRFIRESEVLTDVRAELQTEPGLAITSSGDVNLEFNHQRLVALDEISMEDVVVIGDNWNDVSMLKKAGKGIAMGNASDEIKEIADEVTKSNTEDEVAAVIEKILQKNNREPKEN